MIVRARSDLTAEALCEAIGESQVMTARQVVRDDTGQEVFLSFGKNPPGVENVDSPAIGGRRKPRYLDDEDDVSTAPASTSGTVALTDQAVTAVSGWLNSVRSSQCPPPGRAPTLVVP